MSIGYVLDEGDDLSRDAKIKRLEAENADLKAKLEEMGRERALHAQLATFYSAKAIAASQPPDYGLAIYVLRDLPLTEEFQLRDLAWAHHQEGNTSKSDWEYFCHEWVEHWRQALTATQQEKEDE